jgi:prephenate dehydrogenase
MDSMAPSLSRLACVSARAPPRRCASAPPRLRAAGPGLEDMTRLALGSYEIWRDILATNSDHIEHALGLYIQELEHIRENLRTRQLQEEFERGAALAAQLRKPR